MFLVSKLGCSGRDQRGRQGMSVRTGVQEMRWSVLGSLIMVNNLETKAGTPLLSLPSLDSERSRGDDAVIRPSSPIATDVGTAIVAVRAAVCGWQWERRWGGRD